jgi:hypothetical protein
MIGSPAWLLVSLIAPLRYALARAGRTASTRASVWRMSTSTPPTFALRSTNWAGVIWPFFSASRPNCTPTSSSGTPPKPWPTFFSDALQMLCGRGPRTLIM